MDPIVYVISTKWLFSSSNEIFVITLATHLLKRGQIDDIYNHRVILFIAKWEMFQLIYPELKKELLKKKIENNN